MQLLIIHGAVELKKNSPTPQLVISLCTIKRKLFVYLLLYLVYCCQVKLFKLGSHAGYPTAFIKVLSLCERHLPDPGI